jgi:hypothetical protein
LDKKLKEENGLHKELYLKMKYMYASLIKRGHVLHGYDSWLWHW